MRIFGRRFAPAAASILPKSSGRRRFLIGSAAFGAVLCGSFMHQRWLSGHALAWRGPGDGPLPEIPLIDARGMGMIGYAQERRDRMIELRDACIGPLTPLAKLCVIVGD